MFKGKTYSNIKLYFFCKTFFLKQELYNLLDVIATKSTQLVAFSSFWN